MAAFRTTAPNVELAIKQILSVVDNQKREGLADTPARVARALKEIFGGYEINGRELLTKTFSETEQYDQMVVLRNINFYSICEHHLMPILGVAHVGYIPHKRVVGLSKLARLVDCYARRLQIQERMTQQIANDIEAVLEPKGVGVVVIAKHLCVAARGIRKENAEMVTSAMIGNFRESERTRVEFLSFCGLRHE